MAFIKTAREKWRAIKRAFNSCNRSAQSISDFAGDFNHTEAAQEVQQNVGEEGCIGVGESSQDAKIVETPQQQQEEHQQPATEVPYPFALDVYEKQSFVPESSIALLEDNVAILPDQQMISSLRAALAAHCAAKAAESQLEQRLTELRIESAAWKSELEELTHEGEPDELVTETQRERIAALSAEIADIAKEEEELQVWAHQMYKGLRDDHMDLFNNLENLLVNGELGAAKLAAEANESPDAEPEVTAPSTEEPEGPQESNASLPASSPLEPSQATMICRTPDTTPEGSILTEAESDCASQIQGQEEAESKEEIHQSLISAWHEIEAAQHAFEHRHQRFALDQTTRINKERLGYEVETLTEIGHLELLETRSIVQRLIDGEQNYQMLKAKAIAAGVQPPGSEISSGFLDRSDDGYLLSNEDDDIIGESDRERIELWLDGIPSDTVLFEEMDDVEPDLGIKEPEPDMVDDVAVSDSRSMVAEGSTRRRIDKWRAQAKEIWTSMAKS